MDDPADPAYTLSFDLLFRGMEVTTGGQRIHDYGEQVAKMRARGMNPDDFESYLMLHKYGVPPHGGLGLGLRQPVPAGYQPRHALTGKNERGEDISSFFSPFFPLKRLTTGFRYDILNNVKHSLG